MAGANWRPDVWYGLAMNAEPNDAYTSPVWSDFTTSFSKAENYARGRDFELDQGMSSAPSLIIRDVDELLNPDNPSSTYVNLIQPYRQACLLTQWPRQADITGGAVNLFNVNAWRGNKVDPFDGSFESFAAGSRPNWASVVGATAPAIDTTTPFQGGKDLSWATAATTTVQGASWPVACIPGRQYTCSVYVRQTAASTQRISVTDQVTSSDPFNTTTVASWGTDRLGNAWTVQAGSAAEFNHANLVATVALNAAAAEKIITVDSGTTDHTLTMRMTAPDPALVGNNGVGQGLIVRGNGSGNYYNPRVIWRPDGTVGLATFKRVGGGGSTVVAEVATGWGYKAGDEFIIMTVASTVGTNAVVDSVVWPVTKPIPPSFHNHAVDASLLTGTQIGTLARSDSSTGITFPFTVSYTSFNAVSSVHGSTTAATGAYNRVSVTWTATQPTHTVRLATTGTAAAGTVFMDAIQHEQGAAPSAYSTTGPAIAPIFRSSLERYPRGYRSGGFEAYVTPPCVDAMAALSAIAIETEYAQAVLDTGPDFFWRLNDGADTGLFADTSGNGRPPLSRYVSKYGPGTDIEPETALVYPGSPGGVGVKFTQTGTVGGQATGTALGSTQVNLPEVITSGGNWGFSFSCWAATTLKGGVGNLQALGAISRGPTPGTLLAVMFFEVDETSKILSFNMSGPSGSTSQSTTALPQIFDGLPHHYVATVNVVGTNVDLAVYVDGVAFTGTYVLGAWPASTAKSSLITVGMDTAGITGFGWNGTISDVAIHNRALTALEVSTLNSAGAVAYNTETSGGRVLRRLSAPGRYNGVLRISQQGASPDGLQTIMQAPTWTGQKDLLSDQQETTTAEQGTFWAAPDSAIVFEDRNDRWLRLTSSLTAGEDTGSGEIPYLMDALGLDFDSLYVFADVQVGRNNGAIAQGGTLGDIARARRRYFPRSAGGSFDFANDALPQSMANWIFNTHDQPMVRVASVELDPVANPLLWPILLNLEIGRRITFKRRSKAANNGAGITISHDFFVEKIGIPVIDMEACVWRYTLQLSPINAGASAQGQPTMQPWILGDATYSVLGQTTVLGW